MTCMKWSSDSGFMTLPCPVLKVSQDQGRPSGLVARAKAFSGVAMKVFVEEHQLAPVWIGVKPRVAAVTRALTVRIRQEKTGQA